VVLVLNLPSSCTSASYTLRHHYYKILLLYEQHSFFGKVHTIAPDKNDKPTKKIKLTKPMISNNKRMMLAFENCFENDVVWALNTLMMLS
jgi:hypothetical protein